MGCCMSSSHNSHNPQSNSHLIRILEEETIVKEVVISETPKIPNSPQLIRSPIPRCPESSINEGSDFLSFSAIDEALSLSTSTATTVTMRREKHEEEVVGPSPRRKSFSGQLSGAGAERPGRMRLPENRRGLVIPGGGNVAPQRRRAQPPPAVARRRTNFPGTGGARDGDRRIVEKSVTMKTGTPGYRSVGGSATTLKSRRVVEEQNDPVSSDVIESLENPLVFLECFIFL